MLERSYAIGQAVFIRTDTPDFEEETVAFKTLEELVRICAAPRKNLTLDKILVYSLLENEPCALQLGFLAATRGLRPRESQPSFS